MADDLREVPAAEAASVTRGHDVFVSYSRADRERVVALTQALAERGKRAWVDLEDIPPSAEWMAEIKAAIEAADGYLVVVSPALAGSKVCAEELDHAKQAGKRIVPVQVRPTDPESVPRALSALNWIDATGDELDSALDRIMTALETDLEHTRGHTRLLVRASEWEHRGEDRSLLLRGSDLKEAEGFLVQGQGKEPAPTPVQARFIQASRQASSRRQRGAVAVVTVMFVIAAALGVVALQQRNSASNNQRLAEQRAAESRSRELAATSIGQLDVDPERSLLLAAEAMKSARTPEAIDAIRQSITESHVRATFIGHKGGVLSVSYSPDGTRLLTAGVDGTARVWTIDSGESVVLSGHDDLIEASSFSPDGSRVVTASFDGTARVWDAASGEELAALRGHEGAVHDVAFSPDGNTIVTAGDDGTAMIWDAHTGARLHVLDGHSRPIYDANFSPDGGLLVTASDDDTATIWDPQTGRTIHVLRGHQDGVYSATFDAGGERVVTSSEDGTAKVWDVGSGHLVADLVGSRGPVVGASFSPDGKTVVTASVDGSARIWEATSGRLLETLRGHKDELNGSSYNSDGRLVVTASEDGTARVWDASDGTLLTTLRGHVGGIPAAAFDPAGEHVATAGDDGTVRLWDAASGSTIFRGDGTWITVDREGTRFMILAPDGGVHVIDAKSARELWVAETGVPQTWGGFSGDASLVVSAGLDGVGHVWDAATGDPMSELRGHEPTYLAADFYGTDQVLTWSDDGTARLWDPRSGEELEIFDNRAPIWEAHLSPDGTRVLTTGITDGIIRMWDAETGEQLWKVTGLLGTGGIGAGFSPGGDLVGTVSGPAIIWDVSSGRKVTTLDSTGKPLSVGFSPDGDVALSRFDDGSARIWDPMTGDVLVEMAGHDGTVNSAGFSPDGRWLVTAGDDGSIRVWNPVNGQPIAIYEGESGAGQYAFFTADAASVVSQSQGGVRIDRCDICVATDELITLAARRETRDLSDEERAEYLSAGTHGSDAAQPPRPGLTDPEGEPVQDGVLPAGRYSAAEFDPSLSFMVGDGWQASTFLDRTQFGEVPLAVLVQLQRIDNPSNGLAFTMLSPGRAIDGMKAWDERRNILPFPDDLAAWLGEHPNLETGHRTVTNIGGVDAVSVDTVVTSAPEDPWPVCPECVTLLALSLHHALGPTTTDDLVNALGPGEIDRWIILRTEEGTILVNAFSASRRDFDRFMPIVNQVLQTVQIGS